MIIAMRFEGDLRLQLILLPSAITNCSSTWPRIGETVTSIMCARPTIYEPFLIVVQAALVKASAFVRGIPVLSHVALRIIIQAYAALP